MLKMRRVLSLTAPTLVGIISISCTVQPTERKVYRSADGMHEIVLEGGFQRVRRTFQQSQVVASAADANGTKTSFGIVHSADRLDEAFTSKYPSYHWIGSTVLSFVRVAIDRPPDCLAITNLAATRADTVVHAGDLVFILDVPKQGTLEIPVSSQADTNAYISVEAHLAEPGKILSSSKNVGTLDSPDRKHVFKVIVMPNTVQIDHATEAVRAAREGAQVPSPQFCR